MEVFLLRKTAQRLLGSLRHFLLHPLGDDFNKAAAFSPAAALSSFTQKLGVMSINGVEAQTELHEVMSGRCSGMIFMCGRNGFSF